VVSSLTPILNSIYVEHFEILALDSAQFETSLWLRYIDITFVVWSHGPGRLQNFLSHPNTLKSSIKWMMEIGSDSAIYFANGPVIKEEKALVTKVYRKPTHIV
jgi:hypothetical protein